MGSNQGGRREVYYGWIVVAVTFIALMISAAVRSAGGVLIHPLDLDLHWPRDAVSLGVALGLMIFGLASPLAGGFMDRLGPRRVAIAGMLLIIGSTAATAFMTELWQFALWYGLVGGAGTGAVGAVLGAAVASRWFVARRGFVLGIFGGGTSAGQLVFVPLLMWLVVSAGWRESLWALTGIALVVLVPVALLLRDNPADVGAEPYGGALPATVGGAHAAGGQVMVRALQTPEFWLLAGSFFICGATSNGIVGTHFIPHSIDHGVQEVVAASALALMGAMNITGSLISGWLTDRHDPRRLLAIYYTFRGLSLLLLPFVTTGGMAGLAVFAVLFGLDYIATVPPTVSLAANVFGRQHVGTIYGWIFFSHQVGAASAAYLGGVARVALGDYGPAFLAAGALAMIGGLLASRINRSARPLAVPAPAPGAD